MKTARRTVAVLMVVALQVALVLSCSGCKTGPAGGGVALDPVATGAAVQAIATAGTAFAIMKEPNSRGYLRAASVVCKAAADSGNFDPAQVQASLDAMTVNELKTPEVQALIVAAFGVYKAYWGQAVAASLDKDGVKWVKPVLLGIAEGISTGLGSGPGAGLPAARNACYLACTIGDREVWLAARKSLDVLDTALRECWKERSRPNMAPDEMHRIDTIYAKAVDDRDRAWLDSFWRAP